MKVIRLLLVLPMVVSLPLAASETFGTDGLVQFILGNAKQGPETDRRRQQVQQELALQEAVVKEADRLGVSKRPDVNAKIELARRRVVVEAYWEDFFRRNPVAEAALGQLYKDLKSVNGDSQYRLSQILVKDADGARKVLDALKKKSFSEVAKQMSSDEATQSQGGDVGWRWKSELVPPVARALEFLKPGEITTPPISMPAGLLIVKLDEVRKQDFPALETLKSELEVALRLQAQQKELARLREKQ